MIWISTRVVRDGLFAGVLALTGLACDNTAGTADASGCTATFTGNFSDRTMRTDNCPIIASDTDAGTRVLHFGLSTRATASPVSIDIDLGTSPSPGMFASGSVQSWSATTATETNCVYSAGHDAVPPGSFAMELTAVGDTTAHGRLIVQQTVHAPPRVDCGPGDGETVEVDF